MVFISNHSEKGKHYFTFFIIISGRYLLVTFYEFIKFEILFGKRFTIHHTCRFNRRSAACHPTARGGFLPFDPGLDNIGGTAHTRGNPDGGGRAVLGACPALHASVAIFDCGFFPFHLKHSVGANVFTHAASQACFGVKLQRRYAG